MAVTSGRVPLAIRLVAFLRAHRGFRAPVESEEQRQRR